MAEEDKKHADTSTFDEPKTPTASALRVARLERFSKPAISETEPPFVLEETTAAKPRPEPEPLVSSDEWATYKKKTPKNVSATSTTTPLSPKLKSFLAQHSLPSTPDSIDPASLAWLESSLSSSPEVVQIDPTSAMYLQTASMFNQLLQGQALMAREIQSLRDERLQLRPNVGETEKDEEQQQQQQQQQQQTAAAAVPAVPPPPPNQLLLRSLAVTYLLSRLFLKFVLFLVLFGRSGHLARLLMWIKHAFLKLLFGQQVLDTMAEAVEQKRIPGAQVADTVGGHIKSAFSTVFKNYSNIFLALLCLSFCAFVGIYVVFLLFTKKENRQGGFLGFLDELQQMVARIRGGEEEFDEDGWERAPPVVAPPAGAAGAGAAVAGVAGARAQQRPRAFSHGNVEANGGGIFKDFFYLVGGFVFSLFPAWDVMEEEEEQEEDEEVDEEAEAEEQQE